MALETLKQQKVNWQDKQKAAAKITKLVAKLEAKKNGASTGYIAALNAKIAKIQSATYAADQVVETQAAIDSLTVYIG